MPKRIEYKSGDFIGENGLIYIEEVEPHVSPNGKKRRKARLLCICGEAFETIIYDVKCEKTRSCGCVQKLRTAERNAQDGLSQSPLGHAHREMVYRCYKPSHKGYHRYGGAGVTVYQNWLPKKYGGNCETMSEARVNYINWVEANLPWEKGLHIDKIIDELGYRPDNLQILTSADNTRKAGLRKHGKYLYRTDDGSDYTVIEVGLDWILNELGISDETINWRNGK